MKVLGTVFKKITGYLFSSNRGIFNPKGYLATAYTDLMEFGKRPL